jgi:hypothetical protein
MMRNGVGFAVRVAAAYIACLGSAELVCAHHSFPVHFVPDELVTISGEVTEFRFRNPHGLLFLTVRDGDTEQQWKVETNSPNILRRRGWTPGSIEAGDRVTIVGYPARDGSHFMRVYRVVYPDGRELTGQRPAEGVADGED